MLLGALVPAILLLHPATRQHPFWRMTALALVVIGVVAFRWDTNISGLLVVMPYLPGQQAIAYASYSPSWIEIVTGLGIVSYGLLAFSLGVRYLGVVDHRLASERLEQAPEPLRQTVPA
jgi:molybdopterin-containing oxidoreductase family membrane subunit